MSYETGVVTPSPVQPEVTGNSVSPGNEKNRCSSCRGSSLKRQWKSDSVSSQQSWNQCEVECRVTGTVVMSVYAYEVGTEDRDFFASQQEMEEK
jgi:hypothetical protein